MVTKIAEKCSHCGNDKGLSLQDGYTLCIDREACSERALEILEGRHLNSQQICKPY